MLILNNLHNNATKVVQGETIKKKIFLMMMKSKKDRMLLLIIIQIELRQELHLDPYVALVHIDRLLPFLTPVEIIALIIIAIIVLPILLIVVVPETPLHLSKKKVSRLSEKMNLMMMTMMMSKKLKSKKKNQIKMISMKMKMMKKFVIYDIRIEEISDLSSIIGMPLALGRIRHAKREVLDYNTLLLRI